MDDFLCWCKVNLSAPFLYTMQIHFGLHFVPAIAKNLLYTLAFTHSIISLYTLVLKVYSLYTLAITAQTNFTLLYSEYLCIVQIHFTLLHLHCNSTVSKP
jgi:hypothetical protein